MCPTDIIIIAVKTGDVKLSKRNDAPQEFNAKIYRELFNDIYWPLLETIHRYEIYWGGSGSGKSYFIAQKLAIQLTMMPGRNLICIRKQGTDARDSVYPAMESALYEFGLLELWDIVEHPMPRMTCIAGPGMGNVIAFSGLDKAEDIKSIVFKHGHILTDIWYEEPTGESNIQNFRELDRRLRGRGFKKRVIFSFNPVNEKHIIKQYIWDELLPTGADIQFCHSTYVDNKFLDDEDISTIERFQTTDPYSWSVYGLGLWGTTGLTIFDMNLVNERLKTLRAIKQADPGFSYTASVTFRRDKDDNIIRDSFEVGYDVKGKLTIYKEPVPGRPYAAAFDTAGGGADFHALHICDNITGEQVAVYHSDEMPNVCIFQIIGALIYYNHALVAPEVNFGNYALEKLLEMKYYKIYRRDAPADWMNLKVEPKFGFLTTQRNRSDILRKLVEWTNVPGNINLINDIDTLEEMLTFTRQKARVDVIWAAEPGAHDDLIMAYAILLVCRLQQTTKIIEEKKPLEGFWMPEELEFAVESGKLTKIEALKYKKDMLQSLGMVSSVPVKKGDDVLW